MKFIPFQRKILFAFLFLLALPRLVVAAPQTELLPPGFRPVPVGVHWLKGARVYVSPSVCLTNAAILIRDGFIQAVGPEVVAPPDARVWDMQGMTIYAGFIDAYLTLESKGGGKTNDTDLGLTGGGIKFFGVNKQETESGGITGPGYEVAMVTPERRAAQTFLPDTKALEAMRALGFTTGNIVPDKGIVRGTSALVALSDAEPNRAIIKADVFQHVAFDLDHAKPDVYPESQMGVVAVVRQTFFDAQHYALDQADYQAHPAGRERPAYNLGLEALAPAVDKKMRVVFEPQDALMEDRAARVARELNLDFYLVSSGQEWRRPDLAKGTGVPFIVPLNYPELPKMPSEADWEQATLDEFRAWDWAPENPAVLQNQGLEIALTTFGLNDKKDFRANLRLAIARGLSESNALAALTTVPAQLCGVDKILGTIEPGKIANLTVVDGNGYFDEDAKVRSVWIDGRYYRVPTEEEKEKDKPDADAPKQTAEDKAKADKDKADKEKKKADLKDLQKRVARAPLEGRGVLASSPTVLIRNATIWTSGPKGVLTNAEMLVENGVIKEVGPTTSDVLVPKDTLVIDGTGLHVTPGIIDCHSHAMILGDVNETAVTSSAMVRIGDVVNSETVNIYDELAGGRHDGAPAARLGQSHRRAELPDDQAARRRIAGGPEIRQGAIGSIKFALGENVKQSNWGEKYVTRFPQTRMGVRTFYANRFTAAQQYLKAWADYRASGGVPPRRDLELEALGEILSGTRLDPLPFVPAG
jgi:imidazolonepropionase-like amidohydrolase